MSPDASKSVRAPRANHRSRTTRAMNLRSRRKSKDVFKMIIAKRESSRTCPEYRSSQGADDWRAGV